MRYFLPIANIDKIDLCVVNIEKHFIRPKVYLIYLVNLHFIFHLGQRYFNKFKNVLYVEKPAVGQQITFNRSKMT